MTSAVSSYHDVVSPRIWLEADGAFAQDLLDDLQKFEFDDDESKPSEMTLTVNNPGFKYTDDKRFAEGVRFRVRWGYPGDFSGTYSVVIVKAAPEFPKGTSMPTIVMKAWDMRSDMNRQAHPVNHGAVSSSQVAKNIAKRYNLGITNIEDSKDARPQMRTQPAGTTDIQFLQSLASKLNWDCFIEGTELHFHPKKLEASPVLTFRYYDDSVGTVLSFKPDVKMQKPGGVKKASANPKDASTKGTSSAGANPGDTAMGRWRINTDQAKFTELVRGTNVRNPGGSSIAGSTPETSKNVVGLQANAAKQKIDLSAITAKLEIIGTPRVMARLNIRMEGVGVTYSGNWRVAGTHHTISKEGYRVEVKLTRNALNKGKSKADKTNDKKGSGGSGSGGTQKVVDVNTGSASFSGSRFR